MRDVKKLFEEWLKNASEDKDLINELQQKETDSDAIYDAFYKDLEFGTGGLRGVIGAGTNRMNIYTIGKASQGLANYMLKNVKPEDRKIAIGYDSRIKSDVFAKRAASVYAANGIKVYIYPTLTPVPMVSFATRELKCSFGAMVTASHNPSKYNGYKIYGFDGCQVISEVADAVLNEMNQIDIFNDVKMMDFEQGLNNNLINYISEDVYTAFIERVKKETMLEDEKIDKTVKIVYSPLHGAGLRPVTRILKESGYINITVVKEQEQPDGNFTTCPYPNPEIREAMQLGIEYATRLDADLLFATDPDCDRIGIAVKNKDGEFVLLSGNETGCLLLNYICEMRQKHHKLYDDSLAVKTIVTTDLAKAIAENYHVRITDVLTGFKYIGDQIANLEKQGKEDRYILGFEESYGYLSGSYVRDKDAVNGSFLICEMFAYYKTQNISLLDKLEEFYKKYGYYTNKLKSYEFTGETGFLKMQELMNSLRNGITEISGHKVAKLLDYNQGVDGLPKSNVLKFAFDDGSTVTVRPSGTEPKLKVYLSIKGNSTESNLKEVDKLFAYFDEVCK